MVAVFFAIVIALLLVMMASGYNQNVPYLHPTSTAHVDVVGDRTTYELLYLGNGTFANSTIGTICTLCPISVTPGGAFNYTITFADEQNSTFELTSVTAGSGFVIGGVAPRLPIDVAGHLSQDVTLAILAPGASGTYVLPISLGISVA